MSGTKEYKVYTNHRAYPYLADDLNSQAKEGWILKQLVTTMHANPFYSIWERDKPQVTHGPEDGDYTW